MPQNISLIYDKQRCQLCSWYSDDVVCSPAGVQLSLGLLSSAGCGSILVKDAAQAMWKQKTAMQGTLPCLSETACALQ